MDKVEAIKRIKDHIRVHHIGEYPHIKIAEALSMAISALETDTNVAYKMKATDREKLIELVCDAMEDGCIGHCNHPPCFQVERVVNTLIANGVTFATDNNVGDKMSPTATNADRIRAMSDEELATSHLIIPCFYDDDGYGECKYGWHDRKQTCEECKLEWLKQPAKEEA